MVPGLVGQGGAWFPDRGAVECLHRSVPYPCLQRPPGCSGENGVRASTREIRGGGFGVSWQEMVAWPSETGHQGRSWTEANQAFWALRPVGCVFMGRCLNPSELICRVQMKQPT